jgi:hypothetical protein
MKFDKRGSVGLTTQKLILMVLLILLLILIIYGYTTGGFTPMKEKVIGAFDEVTLMIESFGDYSNGAGGCRVSDLAAYDSDSKGLLTLFNVDETSGSTFTACRGRICYMTIGDNKFMMDKGKFYINLGTSLGTADDFVFKDSPEQLSFYRELYETSVEYLLTAQGAATSRGGEKEADYSSESLEFITGEKMEKFNLLAYGNLNKENSYKAYVMWEQGEWEVGDVENSETVYKGSDYVLALNAFYELVQGKFFTLSWSKRFDLEIRANIGDSQKELGEIVGGGNNELDSKKELETLKKLAYDFMNKETTESKPSVGDFDKFKALVDGKSIVVDGKTFLLSAEDRAGYPLMRLSSDDEVYGLSFSSNLGVWTFGDSNPLGLFKYSNGKWVLIDSKNSYKITQEKFDEVSKFNKVYDFMEERC